MVCGCLPAAFGPRLAVARPVTGDSSTSPFGAPRDPPFGGSFEARNCSTSTRKNETDESMDRCDQQRRLPTLRGIDHEEHSDCHPAPAVAFTVPLGGVPA